MNGEGDFLLYGSATNYFKFDASATSIDIKSDTFDLDATTIIMDNSTNSGVIKLGSSGGPGSATGTTAGAYIDGTGKFNFVKDANNYIRYTGTDFKMAFGNGTQDFLLNSADNSFRFYDTTESIRIDDTIPVYEGGSTGATSIVYTKGGIGMPTNKATYTGSFTGQSLSVYDAPTGDQNVPLIDAIRFQDTANVNPIANAVASTIFMNAAIDSAATTQYALSARVRVKNTTGLLSGECHLYGAYIDCGNTDDDTGNGGAYRKVTDHADSEAFAIYCNAALYQDGANSKNYGIYANAVGADGENWAGYFNNGNVYIKNDLTINQDLFVNDFARLDALRVGTTSTDPGDGNVYIEGTVTNGTWNGTAIATGYIAAALTSQTSMYNAALKIGRDTHNQFDFATDNVIKVSVNAVDDEFRFAAGGDFHADGDVYAYSGTTASDVSLKKNITDTKYGLDDIMKLRGVDFDWKRDDMGHSVGVLAQEVEVIIPEVVKEYDGMKGRDKVKGVDYNKLVPVLIESIKELKLKLDEQDAIIRDITERELEAK
jgi:hypothetical protein